MIFVVPKFNEFVRIGWLQSGAADSSGIVTWAHRYLFAVATVMQHWVYWIIPLAVVWILFEWLIRSENKTLIRLAVMATAAAKLMVVVGIEQSYAGHATQAGMVAGSRMSEVRRSARILLPRSHQTWL